jgi:uncharacterized coiled-coil protein SlyX
MANLFHRLGDAAAALSARLLFAWDALTGAMPLPTPLERTIIMSIHARLAALESAASAQAAINDQVATAASAAQTATQDVAALTSKVDALVADVGTDAAPAEQAQGDGTAQA